MLKMELSKQVLTHLDLSFNIFQLFKIQVEKQYGDNYQ